MKCSLKKSKGIYLLIKTGFLSLVYLPTAEEESWITTAMPERYSALLYGRHLRGPPQDRIGGAAKQM